MPEQICEDLWRYLKYLRLLAGLSSDDLARLLNVTRPTIYNLENKKTHRTVLYSYAIWKLFEILAESDPFFKQYGIDYLLNPKIEPSNKNLFCFKIEESFRRNGLKPGISLWRKRFEKELTDQNAN